MMVLMHDTFVVTRCRLRDDRPLACLQNGQPSRSLLYIASGKAVDTEVVISFSNMWQAACRRAPSAAEGLRAAHGDVSGPRSAAEVPRDGRAAAPAAGLYCCQRRPGHRGDAARGGRSVLAADTRASVSCPCCCLTGALCMRWINPSAESRVRGAMLCPGYSCACRTTCGGSLALAGDWKMISIVAVLG